MEMRVKKTKERGKPKRRWIESVKEDPRIKELYGNEYVNKVE